MDHQPERLVDLSRQVLRISQDKISSIVNINQQVRFLSLNARIEAARSGEAGRGFAIVANQVQQVSDQISLVADALKAELAGEVENLIRIGEATLQAIRGYEGRRLADLAHNMIETMDRNLYERSCDVRWWATDSSVVELLEEPDEARVAHAIERLGVILDSYTVYLDLWVADRNGRIIANGRPDLYPNVIGANVARAEWFRRGLATRDGSDYAALDVEKERLLDNAQVATYSTAIRAGAARDGEPLGVLGVFFDWAKQAEAIVSAVGLSEEEWQRSRCLLVNARNTVIAASDGQGVLSEYFPVNRQDDAPRGFYQNEAAHLVGYALTPGYETYPGLGWHGVIVQRPRPLGGG